MNWSKNDYKWGEKSYLIFNTVTILSNIRMHDSMNTVFRSILCANHNIPNVFFSPTFFKFYIS